MKIEKLPVAAGTPRTRRILRNLSASACVKCSTLLFRMASVPFLISVLGVQHYGDWLVLSAVPIFVSLTSLSIGSISSNTVALMIGADKTRQASRVYSTGLIVVAAGGLIGLICICATAAALWSLGLRFHRDVSFNSFVVICILSCAAYLNLFAEPLAGRLRAVGKANIQIGLGAILPLSELMSYILTLLLNPNVIALALGVLAARAFYVFACWWISHKACKWLRFSCREVRASEIRRLVVRGIQYQSLAIGNIVSNQFTVLVVGYALGPLAVAIFATGRTVARLGTQAVEIINFAVWPELSLLLGACDYTSVARINRAASAITIWLGVFMCVAISFAGPFLVSWMTLGEIAVSHSLMTLFGISMLLKTIWHTSLIVSLAANKYERLLGWYAFATIVAIAACWPLSLAYGVTGAGLSIILVDMLVIPVALNQALEITRDSWAGFSRAFFVMPWVNCSAFRRTAEC